MGEDASSKGGFSTAIWPGVIVIALAVFGLKTALPPLQSARPPDTDKRGFPEPPSPPGLEAFYARLWEDPLLACYRHEAKGEAYSSLFELAESLVGGGEQYRDSLSNLFFPDSQLLCLPVMLPGTPFGDDQEQRMRVAYAVHAALAVSGYQLAFPTRMSYIDVHAQVSVRVGNTYLPGERKFRVPLKLFHKKVVDSKRPAPNEVDKYVVVLWLNEDQMQDRPLNVLAQILESTFRRGCGDGWKQRVDLRLLGPFDSDTLEIMHREASYHPDPAAPRRLRSHLEGFRSCEIYSARATTRLCCVNDDDAKPPIRHVIGNDTALVNALIAELNLRVEPGGAVVLLTERDTVYGRGFRDEFGGKATSIFKRVHQFEFLRGIDGALARDRPTILSQSDQQGGDKPETSQPGESHEPSPQGRSQRDYLTRLERDLVAIDRGQGGDIRAIGVVGSDVYDKLLILRALRGRFPRAVFFTTDLDGAFSNADESKTTRNMIVASHFGLKLNQDLQKAAPPFRDSYQTATYLAALMCLDSPLLGQLQKRLLADPWCADGERAPELVPLVFEIGLDGAYQLTLTSTEPGSLLNIVNSPSPREASDSTWQLQHASWLALSGLAIAFCALPILGAFRRVMVRPPTRDSIGKVLCSGLIRFAIASLVILWPCALVFWDHRRADGQPFSVHHGISLWPATYLRYIALCAAVLLLVGTLKRVGRLRELLATFIGRPLPALTWRQWWRAWRESSWPARANFIWNNFLVSNSPDVWPCWVKGSRFSDSRPSARRICRSVAIRWKWPVVLLRATPPTILFFLFVFCLMQFDGIPSNPYRGGVSMRTSMFTVLLASLAMILLTFAVVDTIRLCRRLIAALAFATPDWKSEELEQLAVGRGGTKGNGVAEWDATRSLFTLHVIVEASHNVGKLYRYPFVIVFLMVIARLPAFDYLELNWILLLIWTLLLVLTGINACELRRAALKTRQDILRRLGDESLAFRSDEAKSRHHEEAIREIKNERGGAFGSLMDDPLVRAIAIPFGGSTLILLIQALLPYLVL